MKERIINEIMRKMSPVLNKEQADRLEIILIKEFEKVKVSEESTELSTYNVDAEISAYLQEFEGTMRLRGRAERTIEQYVDTTKKMLYTIGKPIKEITTHDIKLYFATYQGKKEKLSTNTINNMIRYISAFFNWLEFEDLIEKNPMRKIKSVKSDILIKQELSETELEELRCSAKTEREIALIDFMLTTGLRKAEISKINVSDIKNGRCLVRSGKGSKDRYVFVSDCAMLHINKYLEHRKGNSDALFVSSKYPYERLSTGGIYSTIKKMQDRSGLENVHPHRFRRTFATSSINHGMPIEEVAKLMGHVKIETTMRYWNADYDQIKMHHKQYCY